MDFSNLQNPNIFRRSKCNEKKLGTGSAPPRRILGVAMRHASPLASWGVFPTSDPNPDYQVSNSLLRLFPDRAVLSRSQIIPLAVRKQHAISVRGDEPSTGRAQPSEGRLIWDVIALGDREGSPAAVKFRLLLPRLA